VLHVLGAGAEECFGPAPSAGPASACPACPSGWQAPAGEPGLCCLDQPNGAIECFSQAVPPALPGSSGPVTPPPPGFTCTGTGGGVGPDASAIGGCVCNGVVGGRVYRLACPAGGGACECSVPPTNLSAQVTPGPGGCTAQSSTSLIQQCGFPTQ
jgi:hypothetical protein